MDWSGLLLEESRYFIKISFRKDLFGFLVLFFSTPTFWKVSFLTYVDFQVAAFILMAVYSWEKWKEDKRNGWFVLMSFFSAIAVGAKLTSLVIFSITFLGVALLKGN
jgi:4-amino-4-deoxy-L-arabinose transferase-like glycosyltransferase